MVRVVQISDTHLSPAKRHFAVNWAPLRDWVLDQRADLTVHTGDVTVDGADSEDDMRDIAALMHGLPGKFVAVPGNHDVGQARTAHQPVNAERLARWRRHFGHDWWSHDVENWRLIGIDSMLFGNDDAEEARQLAWLQQAMADAGGRNIAWFTHRPLFIGTPDEPDTGYWSVKPGPRARMLDLIRTHRVQLVGTGHLHKWRDHVSDGCRYVWCGSSGFLVGPDNQPEMAGEKRLGAVTYDFEGSGVTVTRADVPDLTTLWIDDVLHEVYPPHAA